MPVKKKKKKIKPQEASVPFSNLMAMFGMTDLSTGKYGNSHYLKSLGPIF